MTILRQSKQAPTELQDILTKAGGLNLYGEPRFRIVWASSRLTWIGGEWLDYDEKGTYLRTVAELREHPKYVHLPLNCWVIEKWCPPEMYGSRAQWESITHETVDGKRIPALGPYPERGDYECSWPVALTKCSKHDDLSKCLPVCVNHQYLEPIEPTLTVMEQYVARVLRSEMASSYERLKAIEREQEKEKKETARIQKDIWNDNNQLFTGSYVSVPKHYDRFLDIWRQERAKVN